MSKQANLFVGVFMCVFFAVMAFLGVKSPFGDIFKAMSAGSGRSGSGYYYYGGGK